MIEEALYVTLQDVLQELGDILVTELQKELLGQGHEATGDLMRSIQQKVTVTIGAVELEVSYLKYGAYLETGYPGSALPPRPGRAEITALVEWIRVKGILDADKIAKYGFDKAATGFAFGIAYAHRRDGFPLKSSLKYSGNGRITGWQSHVLYETLIQTEEKIKDVTDEQIDIILSDVIRKITLNYN